MKTPDAIRDRAVGSLIGLAVGDALGTTLEFSTRDTLPYVTDIVGGGPFNLKPGQWTDDTQMALALADSLIERDELDEQDLMTRFLSWWHDGAYSCTGSCFDIGITTSQALSEFEYTGDPVAGSTNPRSAGNGSLMRLAPVAIRYWNNSTKLVDAARRQSATTHGARQAVEACAAFATLLADAIAGKTKHEILAPQTTQYHPKIDTILSGAWRTKSRDEIKSSGYVIDCFEAALWCVGRSTNFSNSVLLAANLADDADTVAAITGQLAGAVWGYSSIPENWLDILAWEDRIRDWANRLFDRTI